MKWLVLNAVKEEDEIVTIAINPTKILAVEKDRDKAKLLFDPGHVEVKESFEEVMQLLGSDCGWKMP